MEKHDRGIEEPEFNGWRDFEKAVAEYVASLDPHAVVKHNVLLPDRDTKRPRQRDVWVEVKVLQQINVSIHISCKKVKRKLSSQDIDAFVGELASSGAQKGVIFSYSGFTKPAIEKCKTLGISCWTFFKGRGFILIESLRFTFYCCVPRFMFLLDSKVPVDMEHCEVQEALFITGSDGKAPIDLLIENFHEEEKQRATEAQSTDSFPRTWANFVRIPSQDPALNPIDFVLVGMWRFYRSTLDGVSVSGAYSLTDEGARYSQSSPVIDMQGPEPGPGWERIDEPPTTHEPRGIVVMHEARSLRGQILELFGSKQLCELKRR